MGGVPCAGRHAREAHKNGEVVGPAGGETGEPRCLAEDRKLPQQHQDNWDSKEHGTDLTLFVKEHRKEPLPG